MTDSERIDELCGLTNSPTTLNALHACRDGHPLGRDNGWKWRNAYALACQNHALRMAVNYQTMDWLKARAAAEARE